MTTPGELRRPLTLPTLGELLSRFVQRQAASGVDVLEDAGEVVLHQPSGLLGPDARTVLADALEAAAVLLPTKDAGSFRAHAFKPPADWSSLVRTQETTVAIPFCIGNFPQLVRDAAPLLGPVTLDSLLPKPGQPLGMSSLEVWTGERIAKKRLSEAVFGIGMLRLSGHFAAAAEALQRVRQLAPPAWDELLRNEEASLAWHRGDVQAAATRWAEHPRQDSSAILLNRGLAAMCLEQPLEATTFLDRAISLLPERSAWHHLARLYRTLNEVI